MKRMIADPIAMMAIYLRMVIVLFSAFAILQTSKKQIVIAIIVGRSKVVGGTFRK
jgi:hypothetical protein